MDSSKHSGFDAPVYGEAFPAGSFEKGPDGFLVLNLTGAYSKAQRLIKNIICCVEYDSAYLFFSKRNAKDSKENECIILKGTAKDVDRDYFFSNYNESPVHFYTIDDTDKIIDRTSNVDLNKIDFSDGSILSGFDAPVNGKDGND